jgi:hypothetical protein
VGKVNAIKRMIWRVQGLDPDEVQALVEASHEERQRLAEVRKRAEREARRKWLKMKYDWEKRDR